MACDEKATRIGGFPQATLTQMISAAMSEEEPDAEGQEAKKSHHAAVLQSHSQTWLDGSVLGHEPMEDGRRVDFVLLCDDFDSAEWDHVCDFFTRPVAKVQGKRMTRGSLAAAELNAQSQSWSTSQTPSVHWTTKCAQPFASSHFTKEIR